MSLRQSYTNKLVFNGGSLSDTIEPPVLGKVENHLVHKKICFESGFNNLSNFFRNFRKITQLTPNAYREQMLGELEN